MQEEADQQAGTGIFHNTAQDNRLPAGGYKCTVTGR